MAAAHESLSIGVGTYKIETRGILSLLIGTILVMVVGMGAMSWAMHNSLKEDMLTIQRELKVMTYVLSQPPEKRPKLMMPTEVIERLDRR